LSLSRSEGPTAPFLLESAARKSHRRIALTLFDPSQNSQPNERLKVTNLNDEPERARMRGRLAREWPPIPPRRGMQSNGGRRTSSQKHQLQEPSQPRCSRTHKLYFQGPSFARAPENTAPRPRSTRVVINALCCELLVNTTPRLLRLLPAQPPQDRVCL